MSEMQKPEKIFDDFISKIFKNAIKKGEESSAEQLKEQEDNQFDLYTVNEYEGDLLKEDAQDSSDRLRRILGLPDYPTPMPSDVGNPYERTGSMGAVTGATFVGNGLSTASTKPFNPDRQPKYSVEDVDKLIMMLTLWIEDVPVRSKIEEMYKYWKETQK